jgi:chemotaxis receptor (MCP) glutamine deamidase CheD
VTPLVDIQPRMSGHCGAFQYLRVRKDLPQPPPASSVPARSSTAPRRKWISLYIGEVAASQAPVVLDTLLGSCVAACLYDPVLRAGGMNHILLPNCGVGDRSPRCGVHAMELLINELMKLGGDRRRFVARAFGGADVLKGIRMLSPIGERNVKFVREFLAAEKIPLVGGRLGGSHAVQLFFRTDTGKATVHTVDGSNLPKIITAERSYWKPLSADKTFGGEITLF